MHVDAAAAVLLKAFRAASVAASRPVERSQNRCDPCMNMHVRAFKHFGLYCLNLCVHCNAHDKSQIRYNERLEGQHRRWKLAGTPPSV